ncbi:Mediator of RNA polymerase II transcription subunit 13-like protein, partial [Drosera capensis]
MSSESARAELRDAAMRQVLSSHLLLQKDGFLSTWTSSLVGPWDPSQGLHNPDEKIKLWLFLPGRHFSIVESAHSATYGLRVVASGLWVAPGESEEVSTAFSQALRNRIERALLGLSYVRFGDVFLRCHSYSQSEEPFRKGQLAVEFVFAATEEAIFVHVTVSAKLVRAISAGDMERVLKLSTDNSGTRFPVIVSPHGMRGRLTGCCPSDLVTQVYTRSTISRDSAGFLGLPYNVSEAAAFQMKTRCFFVEVLLGHVVSGHEATKKSRVKSDADSPNIAESDQRVSTADTSVCEKTFIYPTEAVVIPILQPSYAGHPLKSGLDAMDETWSEPSGIQSRHGDNSSSNSNSSSISSINSSSNSSGFKLKAAAGDFETDADSLICRQAGLSSSDTMGAKRTRTVEESFGQGGTTLTASLQDGYKSDFNTSAITGVASDLTRFNWDWDGDDKETVLLEIQALVSEFGDFGDLFESDALPFGEPPGTAESQTLAFSGQDVGDAGGTPSGGMVEVSDQMYAANFPAFENSNPPGMGMEDSVGTFQEVTRSTSSSAPGSYTPAASTAEFEHVMKEEALMTFAPEYGAVETLSDEASSTVFRSPYLPKSRTIEGFSSTSNYSTYGAKPPSSLHSDEKLGTSADSRFCSTKGEVNSILQTKKYYVHVENGRNPVDRKLVGYVNAIASSDASKPLFPSFDHTNAVGAGSKRTTEIISGGSGNLLSLKTVPAAELDCLMFQATMCRIRYTLVKSSYPACTAWNKFTKSNVLNQLSVEPSSTTDNLTRFEVKIKDPIPVRIAGDIDGGMLDGAFNAPVGVWRSVGAPKGAKAASTSSTDVFPSVSHASDTIMSYEQRQPLHDLLDGMAFLVQQAASFVDVALDAEYSEGPNGCLALEEQRRRGFCCGPHMVHAGCGGILASGHSLDLAGIKLVNPLSADISASSVISFLQSDVKTALKSAFGTLDGPLSAIDWCKGCCQSLEAGSTSDGFSAESTLTECSAMGSVGDPLSPLQNMPGLRYSFKDGSKGDDASQRRNNQEVSMADSEQQLGSWRRPTLLAIPYPCILVGYQDDWLKTSASAIQLWEKVPLEPYASQKHMSYYVMCPNIDPLMSAAADFFQQLGTVYETCKLGTHSPQGLGNQLDSDSGKWSSSGFVPVDCPQTMKLENSQTSLVGSLSDYFLSLSNGWDLASFLKSLKKALKAIRFGSPSSTTTKEGSSSPCNVIYVVCPFPEHNAVLKTLIESSIAVGSVLFSADSDRRSAMHNQVSKALSCSVGVDEASSSNTVALSGFSIPRFVLQIVTADTIFRVTNPPFGELIILKEIAFTVYNKARRVSRGSSNDASSTVFGKSHPNMMQMPNSLSGPWKDRTASRISGPSFPRESDFDSGLQAGGWDNAWQTSRSGGPTFDPNRGVDFHFQEEVHYMFEPLFILADPGSLDHGVSSFNGNGGCDSTKQAQTPDDYSSGGLIHTPASTVSGDSGPGSQLDGPESDRKSPPSLHCCYGWTEDWRWLVSVWTDSRGELLDIHIFPFGGTSGRQDTKGMQSLFVQVLQQGCQILQTCSPSDAVIRPRDFVITRLGCLYELEYQEWQKALYSIGGSEGKNWPVQLRRSVPDGMSASSNGPALQQHDMDRSLPSSPSPLYSPHSKYSGFNRGGLGQSNRKQLMSGPPVSDGSRGVLQWVQSISFVTVSLDNSLQLVSQADATQGPQGSGMNGTLSYLEGYSPLPTCLTAESPPLAHLLHSRGTAIPLSTGFVVSKAVPSLKKDSGHTMKEEWPSVLSVGLIDHYGGYGNASNEKLVKASKHGGRGAVLEAKDYEPDSHTILESLAAELHALSWMT